MWSRESVTAPVPDTCKGSGWVHGEVGGGEVGGGEVGGGEVCVWVCGEDVGALTCPEPRIKNYVIASQ